MAVDRSDSRLAGHKTFLARWNERVAKWRKWASARKRSVEFEYWGNHELATRLSREENRGRHWFWFNSEQLTANWFTKQLEESIKNAGERYTPVLHVELPLSQTFEALGRTPAFHARLGKLCEALREACLRLPRDCRTAEVQAAVVGVRETAGRLFDTLDAILLPLDDEPQLASVRPIPWREVRSLATTLSEQASSLRDSLRRLKDERPKPGKPAGGGDQPEVRALETLSSHAFEAYLAASRLGEFCDGTEASVANRPELLLVGGAGQGKTHLLCDLAERDMAAGRPRLLLHGSHFSDAEPWSQIVGMLGLRCTPDQFLGALEAAGQSCGVRVLILIDALNEGDGRKLWAKHLPGMLTRLARSPWLGIAVSVRDSYEESVIPPGLVPDRLTRLVHPGFGEHEYEAVNRFFTHFNIQPTAPLLVPEFSNPLFLKLFCQSVRNLGLHQVPLGLRGITAILDTFLDATNRRLSGPGRMDYDEKSHLVRKAADAVVRLIADTGGYYVPREQAVAAVNQLSPTAGYDRSLFRNLVTEGLLSESRWHIDGGVRDVVHFTYERFADHLLAKHLLDKHVDTRSPAKAFGPRTRIGRLLGSEHALWRYAGLIEALSVQLPERVGKELVELSPGLRKFHQAEKAFVQSLVWRGSKAFRKATFNYLESIWRFTRVNGDVLDALLTVAPVPGHPLNANKLHDVLLQCTMPARDAWWSVFLSGEWGANRAVSRLVDWTWGDSDKSALSDEVVLLTGTALAWCLTSSHRYLRDRATKALVRLFDSRVRLLPDLLGRFRRVDDPYVIERLAAVGYGCAMRATTSDGLKELAGAVAEHVFGETGVRPNLLTRDYGRCLVELARHRGVVPPDAFPESIPPYKSRWPDMRIPAAKTLEKWGKFKEDASAEERAQQRIYWSTTDRHFSDFGKHLGDFSEWTSARLGEALPQTTKGRYEAFLSQLSKRQRKSFDTYHDTRRFVDLCRRLEPEERVRHLHRDFTEQELAEAERASEAEFERTLAGTHHLAEEFRTFVRPYVEHPERYRLEYRFDGDAARRWMVQRVLDYGWTRERFGAFDSITHRRYDRWPERPSGESIGEKYLWIAYRELLARLADNFYLRKDRYESDELKAYSGPWDIGFGHERDIDPSVTIRLTRRESEPTAPSWWSPVVHADWRKDRDDRTWLESDDDLPAVPQMLAVRHPADGSPWYVLDTHINWRQPARLGRKDYDSPHRNLYYILRSYLVRKRHAEIFFRWAGKQHFMDRLMPESPDVLDMALGEFGWAPAYQAWQTEWGGSWKGQDSEYLPAEVLVTALDYVHESSGSDRSIDDSLRIRIPTPELTEGLGLRWSGVEGRYIDRHGKLAATDPSAFETGPGALVVRSDLLTQYLSDKGLELVWTLLGEKQFIGGGRGPSDIGWLEVDGAYRLTNGRIVGKLRAEHRVTARRRPQSRRRK